MYALKISEKDTELIREAMKNLPQSFKVNIDMTYKDNFLKLLDYSRKQANKERTAVTMKKVIKVHMEKVINCHKAVIQLIEIYRSLGLSNIELAGIDVSFRFTNPDPENLLKKSPRIAYQKTFQIVKYLMDREEIRIEDINQVIREYVPREEELGRNESWRDSFKYWQIFAYLVNSLMNPGQVELDIFRNVNYLYKYKTTLFKKPEEKKYNKKEGNKKEGREKREGREGRNNKYFKKERRSNKRGGAIINYEETMGKIYFEEEGESKNLWNFSNKSLRDYLKKLFKERKNFEKLLVSEETKEKNIKKNNTDEGNIEEKKIVERLEFIKDPFNNKIKYKINNIITSDDKKKYVEHLYTDIKDTLKSLKSEFSNKTYREIANSVEANDENKNILQKIKKYVKVGILKSEKTMGEFKSISGEKKIKKIKENIKIKQEE